MIVTAAMCALRSPSPAPRRQSPGRVRHDRWQVHDRALSRRRARDRRQFSGIREGQAFRRHAIPPRHRRLHDSGRRLHRRLQAKADPAPGRQRGSAIEQGRSPERSRHGRDGAHGGSELGDRTVLHQRGRQQVPEFPLARSSRHRLHRFRQGGFRDGRRRQDREVAHRQRRAPSTKDVPVEKVIVTKAVIVDAK